MGKLAIAAAVIISLSAVLTMGLTLQDQKKALPSEALNKINEDIMAKYYANKEMSLDEVGRLQIQMANDALAVVQTENLSGEERLELCDLLRYAEKFDQGVEIAREMMQGDGLIAKQACEKYTGLLTDCGRFAEAEAGIEKYRRRFSPTPEFRINLYFPLSDLATHYRENGEDEKAVQAILAEIKTLDDSAPYASYELLEKFSDSFFNTGRQTLLANMCKDIGGKFLAIAAQRGEDQKAKDKEFASDTNWYRQIGEKLSSLSVRAALIDQPAPGFTFTHYFNTNPISLDDLKGKVVMIDFWSNWCEPCKRAFPHLRELYEKYKDQGFVILSVTSLQKFFVDGDIREGMPEKNLTEERELELTADLIKRHEMTWPVAISDRSCFDPEYGVSGIPTFALLDRSGVIRRIGIGVGVAAEKILDQWAPKLLAEREYVPEYWRTARAPGLRRSPPD